MRMILSHSFILTALLVLLSSTVAQPPPPPTQPPAAPPAPPPCNPFIQVCSNPNCTSSENIGSVQVLSPNTSAYFYVGSAINVSWTYSGETDSTQFPINNIHIYYQKVDAASWNQVATVPARATNYSWLLDTFAAGTGGNFKVRVVPDNVDNSEVTGSKASCTPRGWPTLGQAQFKIVRPMPLDGAPDPYPPSINAALRNISGNLSYIVLMAILAPWYM